MNEKLQKFKTGKAGLSIKESLEKDVLELNEIIGNEIMSFNHKTLLEYWKDHYAYYDSNWKFIYIPQQKMFYNAATNNNFIDYGPVYTAAELIEGIVVSFDVLETELETLLKE